MEQLRVEQIGQVVGIARQSPDFVQGNPVHNLRAGHGRRIAGKVARRFLVLMLGVVALTGPPPLLLVVLQRRRGRLPAASDASSRDRGGDPRWES
jgi:hypothetical protein